MYARTPEYIISSFQIHNLLLIAMYKKLNSIQSALRPHHFNTPWYPLDKRLGGFQSWSGRCGEEKNLAMLGTEPGPSGL
jgi:hypothetical protein